MLCKYGGTLKLYWDPVPHNYVDLGSPADSRDPPKPPCENFPGDQLLFWELCIQASSYLDAEFCFGFQFGGEVSFQNLCLDEEFRFRAQGGQVHFSAFMILVCN